MVIRYVSHRYALRRHLLKFEGKRNIILRMFKGGVSILLIFLPPAIYPEDSKILGSCRGEPIYAREHVCTVSLQWPCRMSLLYVSIISLATIFEVENHKTIRLSCHEAPVPISQSPYIVQLAKEQCILCSGCLGITSRSAFFQRAVQGMSYSVAVLS